MPPESTSTFSDFMATVAALQEQYGDILSDPAAAAAFQNALTLYLVGTQADAALLQRDQAQFARDQMGWQIEEAQDQRAFRRDVEMPFQSEQMLQRLEAERLGLETTRKQYENQRALEAERLMQMQQEGTHGVQMNQLAFDTARLNQAIRREELAALLGRAEGYGRHTPRLTSRDVMSPGANILTF